MLNLESFPVTQPLTGALNLPGDKSISHRALFFGALAEGKTTVRGFLPAEDCLATLRIFRSLGVQISYPEQTTLVINGVGLHGLSAPAKALNCGNSGTTMRLLMGVLAAQPFDTLLIGDESLQRRPMARVSQPLNQMGAKIFTTALGCAPIEIKKNHGLTGIQYTLPIASAQLKSALLFAGLFCSSPLRLYEPILTRDHTERFFAWFGCPLQTEAVRSPCGTQARQYTILPGSHLFGREVEIPGDFSSAAFFIVAATLIEGSALTLRQVGFNPSRIGLFHILRAMGANIEVVEQPALSGEPVADIYVKFAPLQGIQVPEKWVSLAIDEFPILFVAAARASGVTKLTGLAELRHKESDRIRGMILGLNALGIRAFSEGDDVTIVGGVLEGGEVNSFGDHRLAMAFLVAGSVARSSVTVLDCEAVSTSFPSFVPTATQCRLSIRSHRKLL